MSRKRNSSPNESAGHEVVLAETAGTKTRGRAPRPELHELAKSRIAILDPVRDSEGRVVDFEYVDVNDETLAYFALTRDEMIKGRLLELSPAHYASGLFARYVHIVETGEPLVRYDVADLSDAITPGEETRLNDVLAVLVNGKIHCTWTDVSARHAQSLGSPQFPDASPDITIQFSPEGTINWASPSLAQVLGRRPSELVGKSIATLLHPDDVALLPYRRSKPDSNRRTMFEVRILDARDEYHYFRDVSHEMTDSKGRVSSHVAVFHLIDQEVAERDALSSSHDVLEAALQSGLDPHVIVRAIRDSSGRIRDFEYHEINASARLALRLDRGALMEQTMLELQPEMRDSELFNSYVHSVESGEPLQLNDYEFTSDISGTRRRYDFRGIAVGDLFGYSWHDITEYHDALHRYQLIAENASDVVFSISAEAVVEWVSPSVMRLLNFSGEHFIGHTIDEFIHPDDVATTLEFIGPDFDELSAVFEIRVVDAVLGYRWVSVFGREVVDEAGGGGFIGGFHDAETSHAQLLSLEESEERYRLLAENASDVVMRTDAAGIIEWASSSVHQVLGWSPRDLDGTDLKALLFSAGDVAIFEEHRALLTYAQTTPPCEIRCRRADGDFRWLSIGSKLVLDERSHAVTVVHSMRDCQSEVHALRAFNALLHGSRALVRAKNEEQLLGQMCETAVDVAGYPFAWYARKVNDERQSVEKLGGTSAHRHYLDQIEVTWGDEPLGLGPVGRAIRDGETIIVDDMLTDSRLRPWLGSAVEHEFRAAVALPVRIDGEIDGAFVVYAAERSAFTKSSVALLEELADEMGFGLQRLLDQTRLFAAQHDQALLSHAVEQAVESVLVLDRDFVIVYANEATVRSSGYDLDEIIGSHPRIFGSGLHTQEFFEESERVLQSGRPWHGIFVNRRKSGELYEEDTTISPVFDAGGEIVAYAEVRYDLTAERRLESDLTKARSDQDAIVEIMRDLQPAESMRTAGVSYCDAVVRLADIDMACVLLYLDDAKLRPIAISGSSVFDPDSDQTFTTATVNTIDRLLDGPYALSLENPDWPANPWIRERLIEEGVVSVVLAPIRFNSSLIGVLAIGSRNPDSVTSIESRFALFEELGSYAGSYFGSQAAAFESEAQLRDRVKDVIEARRFHPVFQPLVDLETRLPVGYEALTRFDDGVAPDRHFADAHAVGLGSELESIVAAAALEAAEFLSPELFLSVNFSPAALLDGHAAATLEGVKHSIVIEVTEHDVISDYKAVRDAVGAIPGASLAVDDAGAGYTSLSHILELHPEYVKLDISLIRDIDSNPARQAMVAGMCHFAEQSGTILIAEGIETEDEAARLRWLGVTLGRGRLLGQGYFFGRPEALDE